MWLVKDFENECNATRIGLDLKSGMYRNLSEEMRQVLLAHSRIRIDVGARELTGYEFGSPVRVIYAIVDLADYERIQKHRWAADEDGYIRSGSLLLHRYLLDAPGGMMVDHRNGDPFDNRRWNLRLCTHQQNCWNSKSRQGGSSVYKGVTRSGKNSWRWQITTGGWRYWGYCETEEKAALRYDIKAHELYGEFARLNFDHVNGWAIHKQEPWPVVGGSGINCRADFDMSKNGGAECSL